MRTVEYDGVPFLEPRSQPWSEGAADATSRYYDLTKNPAHIRTSLEDFQPWQEYQAIETFYTLLERLNQPSSTLESNDSAFTGPARNDSRAIRKSLVCSGRLMLLFRAIAQNVPGAAVAQLKDRLHLTLQQLDPGFRWGIIGTTLVPVRYLAMPKHEQLGSQLMISFWAFGDTPSDTMRSLQRVFQSLSSALITLMAPAQT